MGRMDDDIYSEDDGERELDLVYQQLWNAQMQARTYKIAAEGLRAALADILDAIGETLPEATVHPDFQKAKRLVEEARCELQKVGRTQ